MLTFGRRVDWLHYQDDEPICPAADVCLRRKYIFLRGDTIMTNPITFPTAATLREQISLNGQRLYNALAKEFLLAIKSSQAEFEEYALVLHVADSQKNDAPYSLANVFNSELSRQLTELGMDAEIEGGKENYIQKCWQGGNDDCICNMIDAIVKELVALGYGICRLERDHGKDEGLSLAILVTWKEGYSGELWNEHCRDNNDESERKKCADLLHHVMGSNNSVYWNITG